MHQAHPQRLLASSRRAAIYGSAIEWEELPSLAARLAERLREQAAGHADSGYVSEFGSAWTSTMPADLDTLAPSQPFRETLSGLAMREVNEPEVFRHFFGPGPRN